MHVQTHFPKPQTVDFLKHPLKKSSSAHKKIFHVLEDHATDVDLIGDVAKTVRDSFGIASGFKKKEINPKITTHMNALADTLGFLEIFGNIKTLAAIAQKKASTSYKKTMYSLKATSSTLGIAYGIMSGLKLTNEIILEKLNTTALSYGQVPVFGLPFITIFNGFDIVKTGTDGAISVFKLKKFSQRLSHAKTKINTVWNTPIDSAFAKTKKNHLKQKKIALLHDATKISNAIEISNRKLQRPGKVSREKIGENEALHSQLSCIKKHYTACKEKLGKWENICQKFKQGNLRPDQLENFRNEKLQKWKIKKINLAWRMGKQILSLILSSVTVLFLFISTVLGFTAIATFPAFLLASGIISLSLSLGNFGKHLLIKYQNDKPYTKPEIPVLV